MNIQFDNKVVLVTGASSGIGRAAALEFARAGGHVVVHYNASEKQAKQVAGQIEALGKPCLMVKADVAEADQVIRMVEKVISEWRRIDILFNNAGTLIERRLLCLSKISLRAVLLSLPGWSSGEEAWNRRS